MLPPSFDLIGPSAAAGRPRPSALQPREWQQRLIQLLRARLLARAPINPDVLLHAGPGAGKTIGALLGFQRLQREGLLDHCIVFCHRTSISRQWRRAAQQLGLTLQDWPTSSSAINTNGSSRTAASEGAPADGWLLSYQAAAHHSWRLKQELQARLSARRWLAIADEVHHLGLDPDNPEAKGWGQVFTDLSAPASLRLGLSGTPFRADALAFCAARRIRVEQGGTISERIVPDLCIEPHRLILAGDVRPLEFRFQDGWVEHGRDPGPAERECSPLSQEGRESWRARNLRRAIQPGDGGGIAQRLLLQARRKLDRVRQSHPQAGGLVVARDINHAARIAALLQEEGEAVQLVHSQDPEATARLGAFRAGEGRWLVSVDMCAEGFDAPRLRVVAYLSTVVTRSRFVQAITRAVRMDGARAALEGIPRDPSFVFAPADPLLIAHARTWSRSEPYVIRGKEEPEATAIGAGGMEGGQALTALAEGVGAVIPIGGPELPGFLRRRA
jgi:hypothetical protein